MAYKSRINGKKIQKLYAVAADGLKGIVGVHTNRAGQLKQWVKASEEVAETTAAKICSAGPGAGTIKLSYRYWQDGRITGPALDEPYSYVFNTTWLNYALGTSGAVENVGESLFSTPAVSESGVDFCPDIRVTDFAAVREDGTLWHLDTASLPSLNDMGQIADLGFLNDTEFYPGANGFPNPSHVEITAIAPLYYAGVINRDYVSANGYYDLRGVLNVEKHWLGAVAADSLASFLDRAERWIATDYAPGFYVGVIKSTPTATDSPTHNYWPEVRPLICGVDYEVVENSEIISFGTDFDLGVCPPTIKLLDQDSLFASMSDDEQIVVCYHPAGFYHVMPHWDDPVWVTAANFGAMWWCQHRK